MDRKTALEPLQDRQLREAERALASLRKGIGRAQALARKTRQFLQLREGGAVCDGPAGRGARGPSRRFNVG